MKKILPKKLRVADGFTLIEILVTIIISAILAVVLTQVMSGQSQRSYRPIQVTEETLLLKQAMENITADHARLLRYDPTPLMTLQRRLKNEGGSGYWEGDVSIQVVENYCFSLGEDGGPAPGESGAAAICGPEDTLLKLTLSLENQSLTALFTR